MSGELIGGGADATRGGATGGSATSPPGDGFGAVLACDYANDCAVPGSKATMKLGKGGAVRVEFAVMRCLEFEEVGARRKDRIKGADHISPDAFNRVKGRGGVLNEFLHVTKDRAVGREAIPRAAGPRVCDDLQDCVDAREGSRVGGRGGWAPGSLSVGDQVSGGGKSAGQVKEEGCVIT